MELHLIRHGQTNWNEERRVQGQSESTLTERGIQQAKQLGERITHLKFDQVFCSSSVRTRQTADHVFANRNFNIEYLDSLREIFLGSWEGHLYDDIADREPDSHRHFWEQPHLFNVEGAETFFDLQNRAVKAVSKMATDFNQKKIAIVSHGALIKSFLSHVEGRAMENLWAPPKMHNCAHSIVEIKFDKENQLEGKIVQYADQNVGNKN
ncbi:MAG: hypothetical protein COA96_05155 [SAR86 cluster bacterium]|uniref:Histidine phosphatase family protein n=1 Tax=SAR86 cluster bacterium TaxID=2030880 RepID=A0A2A5B4C7_9GAMM|nr:MAG: hypothetical protein COA96_05155 [SAR86 cluster bacterium]